MRQAVLALWVVLACVSATQRSAAAPANPLCHLYHGWDPDLPGEAREILRRSDVGSAMVCKYPRGDTWFAITGVTRVRSDVCQYNQISVSWEANEHPTLEPLPRNILMAFAKEDCPPPGDDIYVHVFGLTPGSFASLMRAWRQVSKSEGDFMAATAHLSRAQRKTDAYITLKEWLVDPRAVDYVLPPYSIRISEGFVDEFVGGARHRVADWSGWYEMMLTKGLQVLYVKVDLTDDGWRIFDVQQTHLDPAN